MTSRGEDRGSGSALTITRVCLKSNQMGAASLSVIVTCWPYHSDNCCIEVT